MSDKSKVIGMIPARYGSTRLPGKPLLLLAGKSLIQRTYENAKRCPALDELTVVTDDERIIKHVSEFGGRAIMTSHQCPTGTERIAEAIKNTKKFQDADIIVNVQGDEPFLEPEVIEQVVKILYDDPERSCPPR